MNSNQNLKYQRTGKMNKTRDVLYITNAIAFMLMVWLIDISYAATTNNGFLTNGFWTSDPVKMYHIGLWGAIIFFYISNLLHYINWRNKKKK